MKSEDRGSKNEWNVFSLLGELDGIIQGNKSETKIVLESDLLFMHGNSVRKEIDTIYCAEDVLVRIFRRSFNTQVDVWSMG